MSDPQLDQTEEDRVTGVEIVDGNLVFRRFDGSTLTYEPSGGGFNDGPYLGFDVALTDIASTPVEDFLSVSGLKIPLGLVTLWEADNSGSVGEVDTTDLDPDPYAEIGDYRLYEDEIEFLTAGLYSVQFNLGVEDSPEAQLLVSGVGFGGGVPNYYRDFLTGSVTMPVVAENLPGGGVGGRLSFWVWQAAGSAKDVNGSIYISRVA